MKLKKIIIRSISILFIILFFVLTVQYFDFAEILIKSKAFFLKHPKWLVLITICYFTSFLLRAIAWKKYLNNQVRLRHCLQGVLLSLFINHITPVKLGDIVRIGILRTKEKHITWDEATHSVVIMRFLDIVILGLFSLFGLFFLSKEVIIKVPIWFILLMVSIITFIMIIVKKVLPLMFEKHWTLLRNGLFSSNILFILPLIVMSWILEGSVVWGVMKVYENDFSFLKAVMVNSITVGGQIFQITPGGITTYEAIMSLTLGTLGVRLIDAYQIAFISHAYKFLFSYGVGLLILVQAPKTKWKEIKKILDLKRGERA